MSTKPDANTRYLQAGSEEDTLDLIRAQDRARSDVGTVATNWAPWLVGGLAVGAVLYFVMRE